MYFFLINNDYHFKDACKEIENAKIPKENVLFICVPHKIDIFNLRVSGYKYVVFESPLLRLIGFLNVFSILKIKNEIIDFAKKIGGAPRLYIYTEYELLNHLVVKIFKKKGSDVFIIEDNGLATYAINKMAIPKLTKKIIFYDCKFIIPAFLLGVKETKVVRSDGNSFPVMEDGFFSGCIYRNNVSNLRAFPTFLLKKKMVEKRVIRNSTVLYLNQDIYNFYMTKSDYFKYLDLLVTNMKKKYDRIIFKFHPREVGKDMEFLIKDMYKELDFIDDVSFIESGIYEISPCKVLSFNSSALIGLENDGWDVEYTFHQWNRVKVSPMLEAIETSLDEISSKLKSHDVIEINTVFDV
ncbi:polysialyltransferase family glycosyltransferase [Marinomonas arenicola]|uniref:Polysialyltransferase family glycosyltransferase n=1 Tax=Marinomonas arenicola TaxID=569601 RepID=A0ABU9G5N3_9GAMM